MVERTSDAVECVPILTMRCPHFDASFLVLGECCESQLAVFLARVVLAPLPTSQSPGHRSDGAEVGSFGALSHLPGAAERRRWRVPRPYPSPRTAGAEDGRAVAD